jgi:hypothetical protein
VQTGDNVMIGGFINQGPIPIKVLVRAIGPSLGTTGVLANPVLELHEPDGTVITNDDWMTDPAQKADIMATTIPPPNALESAIAITLPVGSGAYTAIVKGVNDTTGVALVEAYFGNPVDGCLGIMPRDRREHLLNVRRSLSIAGEIPTSDGHESAIIVKPGRVTSSS